MRIYATTENGRRIFVELVCDHCGAVLKPGPHVLTSGWKKRGLSQNGYTQERDYCSKCKDCV